MPDYKRNNSKRRSQAGTKTRPGCKKVTEKRNLRRFVGRHRMSQIHFRSLSKTRKVRGNPTLRRYSAFRVAEEKRQKHMDHISEETCPTSTTVWCTSKPGRSRQGVGKVETSELQESQTQFQMWSNRRSRTGDLFISHPSWTTAISNTLSSRNISKNCNERVVFPGDNV